MTITYSDFDSYTKGFKPHIMFYSFNGAGKTTLAGTTGLRTILLDCGDSGVMTLRKADKSKLKIVKIESIAHFKDVAQELHRILSKFDLLVVDTTSGLQNRAVKEVRGRGEMSQRKWGQVGGHMIECLSEIRTLPKNVIYLAQEKRKSKEEDTGTVQVIGPELIPSVRTYVSSCVDWVGRIYLQGGERKLSFILSDYVEAKDRGDLFPKVLTLPREGAYLKIHQRIVSVIKA